MICNSGRDWKAGLLGRLYWFSVALISLLLAMASTMGAVLLVAVALESAKSGAAYIPEVSSSPWSAIAVYVAVFALIFGGVYLLAGAVQGDRAVRDKIAPYFLLSLGVAIFVGYGAIQFWIVISSNIVMAFVLLAWFGIACFCVSIFADAGAKQGHDELRRAAVDFIAIFSLALTVCLGLLGLLNDWGVVDSRQLLHAFLLRFGS